MSDYTADYTGLGATAWELFSGEEPGADYDFFKQIIVEGQGPALDVGCATGRLLLPYLQDGLDIDGVDPSADILDICRRRAEKIGLSGRLGQQKLERQSMQTLNMGRTYQTIFVPCGTIQLVVRREEVFEALSRFYQHLKPNGTLVLTSYPRADDERHEKVGEWWHKATKPLSDGTELSKHAVIEYRDLVEQTRMVTVRYRRLKNGEILEEQLCTAPERWYYKHEMVMMLEKSGFQNIQVTGNYTDEPLNDSHYVMAFIAKK